MKRRTVAAAAAGCIALLGPLALGSASASMASLGGLTAATLLGDRKTQVAKTCPTVSDSFNVSNRALNGQPVTAGQGQSWSTPSAYTITGSAASVAGSPPPSGTALAAIPWLATDSSISAAMTLSGSYQAGLAMFVSTSSNSGMTLQLLSSGTNRTRLVKVVAGTSTVVKSVAFTPVSGTWTLEYRSGAFHVSLNGSEKLLYPSTAAEQTAWDAEKATWLANTQIGLVAVGAQPNTRWDNLAVSCL